MAPSRDASGHLAIVLHAHLPYVRHPEHARSLEERWQHEALWETYLPLVEILDRLENEGIPSPVSISVSPPLAAMWSDPWLRARSRDHLDRTRAVAERARSRMGPGSPFFEAIVHHEGLLARAEATLAHHRGDVLGALARHHREGRIHLFTTAVTHAFLPGLARIPAWARAQIALGKKAFEALSGIATEGLWLPECAFAPWIDPLLTGAGIGWSVLDAHGVALAEPRPDVITLGAGEDALVVPVAPIRSPRGEMYFGRDQWVSRSVWGMKGYPADPAYREFHRDLGFDAEEADLLGEIGPAGTRVTTGIKLHRITGPGDDKAPYEPSIARARAKAHAAEMVADRARLFAGLRQKGTSGPPPLSVAPFDAELFGHFWHEGVVFLEEALRILAVSGERGGPRGVTLAEAAEVHRRGRAHVAEPAASTWGEGGFATTWTGPKTASLWRHVHHAAREVTGCTEVLRRGEEATPKTLDSEARRASRSRLLEQAIVEALLLQSSDFAFMIHRGTTAEYAARRAALHAGNARKLARLAIAETVSPEDAAWARALGERTPFLQEIPGEELRAAIGSEGFNDGEASRSG